jgi:hypothetical protein
VFLVPVIFANGEDDDGPGLIAAFRNEDVWFDDRLYRPGDDLTIEHRQLFYTRGIRIEGTDGSYIELQTFPADPRIIVISAFPPIPTVKRRQMVFNFCQFTGRLAG